MKTTMNKTVPLTGTVVLLLLFAGASGVAAGQTTGAGLQSMPPMLDMIANFCRSTGLYAFLIRSGFSINTVVVAFGLFVAGTMYLVKLRHEANQRQFDSVAQLDDIRH